MNKDNYIFAKNSFDQWSLIYLKEIDYGKILKFISNINLNDEILLRLFIWANLF